jgi:hypothetical protein
LSDAAWVDLAYTVLLERARTTDRDALLAERVTVGVSRALGAEVEFDSHAFFDDGAEEGLELLVSYGDDDDEDTATVDVPPGMPPVPQLTMTPAMAMALLMEAGGETDV